MQEGAAQFIITTFHPQIVEVADKAYGVQHSNCVSTIVPLAHSAALKFVRDDKSHQGRGAATSGGSAAGVAGKRPSKRLKENEAGEDNRGPSVAADV